MDALLTAVGGKKIRLGVEGPLGEKVPSFFGILPDGTAVIESAAAAGLPLTHGKRLVMKATTYGVGQLIRAALDRGCRKLLVGMGGTATNDGGTGLAAALGARFLDQDGREFLPAGGTLSKIRKIDLKNIDPRVRKTEITAMCDVGSPLCGENGAAAVFGPQKGASAAEVTELDDGLHHLADLIRRAFSVDVLNLPGGGAAGGMGAGMAAFCGARLQKGIETVLGAVHFDELLPGTDLVVTGEGCLDGQSLQGKVISGIAAHTSRQNIPLIAVAGDVKISAETAAEHGIGAAFSINRVSGPFEILRERSSRDLEETLENIFRLCRIVQKGESA